MNSFSGQPKVLFIGVDGMSWSLTRALVDRGLLPVLGQLARRERLRELTTAFPPHTAPGWTSIFTGVQPGQHGIYSFWELQAPGYRPALMGALDMGWEPLWLTLARHGLSVGVYNVPLSHPPEDLPGGFMITWPLAATLSYASPRSLIHELHQAGMHYQSDLTTMYKEDVPYIEEALGHVDRRARTVVYLREKHPVDALLVVFTELDRVCHRYWRGPGDPGDEVESIYIAIDQAIGQILSAMPDDCVVVIASDHGFGHCTVNVQINLLLREAGLLSLRPRAQATRATPQQPFFEDAGAAAGNTDWFSSLTGTEAVDWERTRAYMPAPGCFGVNLNLSGRQSLGIVSPREAGAIEAALREAIEGLLFDGEPLFQVVRREEVYAGARLRDAADYILLPRRWDIMPHPGVTGQVLSTPLQRGVHRMDGVLAARGLDLAGLPGSARVDDVTPSILHRLGLPVAAETTGRILGHPEAAPRREPPLRIDRTASRRAPGDPAVIEQRLRALGYL